MSTSSFRESIPIPSPLLPFSNRLGGNLHVANLAARATRSHGGSMRGIPSHAARGPAAISGTGRTSLTNALPMTENGPVHHQHAPKIQKLDSSHTPSTLGK